MAPGIEAAPARIMDSAAVAAAASQQEFAAVGLLEYAVVEVMQSDRGKVGVICRHG